MTGTEYGWEDLIIQESDFKERKERTKGTGERSRRSGHKEGKEWTGDAR